MLSHADEPATPLKEDHRGEAERTIAPVGKGNLAPSLRNPWSKELERAMDEAKVRAVELEYAIEESDDQPLGYVGPVQAPPARRRDLSSGEYFPIEDRWRIGFPQWDRYARGRLLDPYHQNVLKGDYPISGQDIFFSVTAFSDSLFEIRKVPVKVGDDEQRIFKQNFLLTFDLFEGDNSLHPSEWFLRITPAFNVTDVTDVGTKDDTAIQEGFADVQLAILSNYYDTLNLRVGRQGFVSDFRGFLFADVNDAARLFGNAEANRWQYNAVVFDTVEKDPVSAFNTFNDRQQLVVGANVIRQDTCFEGFNVLGAVLYDRDQFKQQLDAVWLELAGDGHIGPYLVSTAFIQALGRDEFNPIAKRDVTINAQFAALEVARQLDWFFPKVSLLYASGDHDPADGRGRGFDAVFDNPFFAGAGFSYLNREAIAPGGVILSNGFSFLPNLRTKANDPSNFVNPGLFLLNAGFNANVTTRLFAQANVNYYQLIDTDSVEVKAFDVNKKAFDVGRDLGVEVNVGFVFKPLIIDNVVLQLGASALWPGDAIKDLSGNVDTLYMAFGAVTLVY